MINSSQLSDNELEKISGRLKEIRQKLGLTQKQLAEKIGYAQNTVSEKETFSPKLIKNGIALRYLSSFVDKLGVSEDYIYFGTGKMMAHGGNPISIEATPIRLADPQGFEASEDKFYKLADGSTIMQVPIVKEKAYAGYLVGFSDPEFYDDLETLPLPVDGLHRGSYLAFEVSGWSMVCYDSDELAELSVRPGWIAIGRDIPKEKWKYRLHTHTTDTWVIVHKERGILIKQIINHDVENAAITIHSLNPDFQDEIFSLNDIEQIFSVVQVINRKR